MHLDHAKIREMVSLRKAGRKVAEIAGKFKLTAKLVAFVLKLNWGADEKTDTGYVQQGAEAYEKQYGKPKRF